MGNEHTQKTDVYRFRRVKWGNPRHQMNKLRNAMPAMAEGERETVGIWYWIAVAVLSAITFISVYLIATGTQVL